MAGLSNFKERMKAIQDNIKTENDKADACIKDKENAHRTYCRTVGKQQQLKEKIISKEEEIERMVRKVKDMEDRLRQKEEFLKEAAKFNKNLTKGAPSAGDSKEIEKRLNQYKVIYHKNNDRYMQAKERKIDLEQRFENLEERGKDVYRKVDALNQELETNLMEEGRRAEQCKQTMDAAFKNERNCLGVQHMLDDLDKRTKDGIKNVSQLQKKKTKTEDELEETCYDRRVIEATIKEILLKS